MGVSADTNLKSASAAYWLRGLGFGGGSGFGGVGIWGVGDLQLMLAPFGAHFFHSKMATIISLLEKFRGT